MPKLLRDPVYLGALATLVGVFVLALALLAVRGGSSSAAADTAVVVPTAVATSTSAPPTATPTAVAVPTPQLYEVLLDAKRAIDLSALADALAAYRQRFGAYPATGGATIPLCTGGGEPGCVLSSVTPGLSYDDGTYDYLYESDGTSFTLATRLQTALSPDGCAGAAPAALAGLPVYCIRSKGGR